MGRGTQLSRQGHAFKLVPPSSQKIALQLKATLENVTNLRPVGEDFRWYLKVRRKEDSSWEREEHRDAVGILGLRTRSSSPSCLTGSFSENSLGLRCLTRHLSEVFRMEF